MTPPSLRHRRIAELSDGKRALWSMLSMQQQKQKPTARADGTGGADAQPAQAPTAAADSTQSDGSVRAREEALTRAELALAELRQARGAKHIDDSKQSSGEPASTARDASASGSP